MTTDYDVEAIIREAETDRLVEDIKLGDADVLGIQRAERGEQGEAIVGREKSDFTKSEAFVADPADADKIVLYSQIDGTPSNVLLSMLSFHLRKRIPADPNIPEALWGQRAFDRYPPPAERIPDRRSLKCWLHPEHPNREVYNAIGLAGRMCRKWNIPTAMDVELHVRHKHPSEYEVINNAVEKANTDADRQAARQQTDALLKLVEELVGTRIAPPQVEASAELGEGPVPSEAMEASAPTPNVKKVAEDTAPDMSEVESEDDDKE